ncbi:MAG: SUMF1/EgtB/PvdO family nonheme iron enzyme [Desulfamplus sp.]|nr:SUMF1/EgtB/PvdO family nonheme iron enzyme [Desulfamplus sp.]
MRSHEKTESYRKRRRLYGINVFMAVSLFVCISLFNFSNIPAVGISVSYAKIKTPETIFNDNNKEVLNKLTISNTNKECLEQDKKSLSPSQILKSYTQIPDCTKIKYTYIIKNKTQEAIEIVDFNGQTKTITERGTDGDHIDIKFIEDAIIRNTLDNVNAYVSSRSDDYPYNTHQCTYFVTRYAKAVSGKNISIGGIKVNYTYSLSDINYNDPFFTGIDTWPLPARKNFSDVRKGDFLYYKGGHVAIMATGLSKTASTIKINENGNEIEYDVYEGGIIEQNWGQDRGNRNDYFYEKKGEFFVTKKPTKWATSQVKFFRLGDWEEGGLWKDAKEKYFSRILTDEQAKKVYAEVNNLEYAGDDTIDIEKFDSYKKICIKSDNECIGVVNNIVIHRDIFVEWEKNRAVYGNPTKNFEIKAEDNITQMFEKMSYVNGKFVFNPISEKSILPYIINGFDSIKSIVGADVKTGFITINSKKYFILNNENEEVLYLLGSFHHNNNPGSKLAGGSFSQFSNLKSNVPSITNKYEKDGKTIYPANNNYATYELVKYDKVKSIWSVVEGQKWKAVSGTPATAAAAKTDQTAYIDQTQSGDFEIKIANNNVNGYQIDENGNSLFKEGQIYGIRVKWEKKGQTLDGVAISNAVIKGDFSSTDTLKLEDFINSNPNQNSVWSLKPLKNIQATTNCAFAGCLLPKFTDGIFSTNIQKNREGSVRSSTETVLAKPSIPANRAETLLLAMLVHGDTFEQNLPSHYSDVPTTYELYDVIETATKLGIVQGYDGVNEGYFAPENTVTRAEALKIIFKTFNLDLLENSDQGPRGRVWSDGLFYDLDSTHWSYKYAKAAYLYEIMDGFGDGRFAPNAEITRSQLVKIVHQAMQLSNQNFITAGHFIEPETEDYSENNNPPTGKVTVTKQSNGNYKLKAECSDPDYGQKLSYYWIAQSGSFANISPDETEVEWIPSAGGTVAPIELWVTDGHGLMEQIESEIKTTALPAPQLNLTTNDKTITMSWQSVPNAAGYILYCTPNPLTDPPVIYDINLGNMTNIAIELWNGASFYVAIMAYNNDGFSPLSNIEVFEIKAETIAPPTNLSTQAGDESVTLQWDPVDGSNGYVVYVATNPNIDPYNPATIIDYLIVSDPSATIDGLTNYVIYYFGVTTIIGAEESDLSDVVQARPEGRPDVTILEMQDSLSGGKTTNVGNISNTEDSERYFMVSVPTGAKNLVILTENGLGDVDLYVKRGSKPSLSDYDCISDAYGADEECRFDNPTSGDYYMLLYGYEDYEQLTIRVNWEQDNDTMKDTIAQVKVMNGSSILEGPYEKQLGSGATFNLGVGSVVEVSIHIQKNTIDFDYSKAGSGSFSTANFNGYQISFIDSSFTITNVEIDDENTSLSLTPDRISFNSSSISVNVQGLRYSNTSRIRLNISTKNNLIEEPIIPGNTFTNSLDMTFNLIPAGTFMMGSPEDEPGRESDETQHRVTLTQPYYMQTTEVTQGQWKAVMGSNPSYFQNCGDDCPVENVSWDDAQAFIAKLNQLNQRTETQRGNPRLPSAVEIPGTYSLPTEAQWEYAARANSTTAFANGSIIEPECEYDPNLDSIGWYCGNSDVTYQGCRSFYGRCIGTHPVAEKNHNTWGLYDMHGNVSEWCQDWFGNYNIDNINDPTGPSSGSYKVIRNGNWVNYAYVSRSAYRYGASSYFYSEHIGFRLVVALFTLPSDGGFDEEF